VRYGPLPLKMWILPGQGQGSKLKSRSDGQIINFDRVGYLSIVVEIEAQVAESSGGSVNAVGLLVCSRAVLVCSDFDPNYLMSRVYHMTSI